MKKIPILLLLITSFSFPASAEETSRVDELKAMLDGLGRDEVDEKLIEAYLQNRSQADDSDWSFWTGYSNSDLDDDRNVNAKEADGDTYSIGLDYRFSPRLLMGAAFITQDTDVTSDPSPAPVVGFSETESDGDGFSLYGVYVLGNGIGVDANFSYMATDLTITDFSALAAPTTKSTDGDNFIFSAGANLLYPFSSQFWANGRFSYTHAWGDQDSYFDVFGRFQDEQDYYVGTLGLKANLNYAFNRYLRSYAGINLGYDVISDIANPALVLNPGGTVATAVPFQKDRNNFSYGFQAGIIVDFNQFASMSGGYQQQNWGSDLDVSSFALNLRILF